MSTVNAEPFVWIFAVTGEMCSSFVPVPMFVDAAEQEQEHRKKSRHISSSSSSRPFRVVWCVWSHE